MIGQCQLCDVIGLIHIHHKDFNHGNNAPENRIAICPTCHRRIHVDARLPGKTYDANFHGKHTPLVEMKLQYFDCFPRANVPPLKSDYQSKNTAYVNNVAKHE